jgi:prepilin-type N-terminal cleavage/methylation domain-containing protein
MKMKKMNDEKGFSLLEVLVAVAIMGGISLVMLQMNQNQLKGQKTTELKGEISDIMNIIRQVLNNQEACDTTFSQNDFQNNKKLKYLYSSSDLSKIFAEVGNVKFQNFNVYIKEMRLLTRAEEVSLGKTHTVSKTDGYGSATLKITFVKNPGAIGATSTPQQFFGGKETVQYLTIFGYFYDFNYVFSTVQTELRTLCTNLAAVVSITCDFSNPDSGCWYGEESTTKDYQLSDGTMVYKASCKFYRDESPLKKCKTI